MHYRILGRTGLRVSEIGFGSYAIGQNQHRNSYNPGDISTSLKAIAQALELGCNFFDTADVFGVGHSEEVLAKGLIDAGKLNEVLIATGCNFYGDKENADLSGKYIGYAVEQSLRRLKRDYLDICQLHNPIQAVIETGQAFEVLDKLKEQGKIRYYGVSVQNVKEGLACLNSGKADTIQIPWNIFSLAKSYNPSEDLFPVAQQQNIGIITREPLANGILSGKHSIDTKYEADDLRSSWSLNYRTFRYRLTAGLSFLERTGSRTLAQAALRFALDTPGVSTVICGMRTSGQVLENLTATNQPELSKNDLDRINKLFFD